MGPSGKHDKGMSEGLLRHYSVPDITETPEVAAYKSGYKMLPQESGHASVLTRLLLDEHLQSVQGDTAATIILQSVGATWQ